MTGFVIQGHKLYFFFSENTVIFFFFYFSTGHFLYFEYLV